jgi:hypothetical protein
MERKITAEDARKKIEPGWNRLIELLSDIPEDLVEKQFGRSGWSIKVLVGHIAYWERHAARVIQVIARGETPAPIEFMVVNQEVAAIDASRAYVDVRRDLDNAHEELLMIVDESGEVGSRRLGGDTWGHYPEHIKQLEKWLQKSGA